MLLDMSPSGVNPNEARIPIVTRKFVFDMRPPFMLQVCGNAVLASIRAHSSKWADARLLLATRVRFAKLMNGDALF